MTTNNTTIKVQDTLSTLYKVHQQNTVCDRALKKQLVSESHQVTGRVIQSDVGDRDTQNMRQGA